MSEVTFGRRFADSDPDVAQVLAASERGATFTALENILLQAIRGKALEQVSSTSRPDGRWSEFRFDLNVLSVDARAEIQRRFDRDVLLASGAWFLPGERELRRILLQARELGRRIFEEEARLKRNYSETELIFVWAAAPFVAKVAAACEGDAELAQRISEERTRVLLELARRHYAVANEGRALRRRVIHEDLQRSFVLLFSGAWLQWLRWLGEEPHPDEEIIQSLPAPKLFVSAGDDLRKKVLQTAAETGLPIERVKEVVAALHGSTQQSPIDARMDIMKRFWFSLGEIERTHVTTQGSLWGIVGERKYPSDDEGSGLLARLNHEATGRALPAELSKDIETLWGTCCLPRWPDALVFEPFPHAAMSEAVGPALAFWHQAFLTSWFVSEGPMSRTPLADLRRHYTKLVHELDERGFPVPSELFEELRSAEESRGEPEQLWKEVGSESMAAMSVTASMGAGTRLGGFETFRDIIARHRAAWTDAHFDKYLRHRWEGRLLEVQSEVNKRIADKGKPPTAKQFASLAGDVANAWFGGDLGLLASAIAAKVSLKPTRTPRITGKALDFFSRMYPALKAEVTAPLPNTHAGLFNLSKKAVEVVQQWEASGEAPTSRESDLDDTYVAYYRQNVFQTLERDEDVWLRFAKIVGETAAAKPSMSD